MTDQEPTVVRTPQQWREVLTPFEFSVLREGATERPGVGEYEHFSEPGTYACKACGAELFTSEEKFASHCGWPSFFAPYDPAHIRYVRDTSHGMVRVEETCARCGSHLGHVFPDGPPPTHERHCLNSVSLAFVLAGEPLPDPLGREDARAAPSG